MRLEITPATGRSLAALQNITEAHRAEMTRLVNCVEQSDRPGAWCCLDFTMPSGTTYRVVIRKSVESVNLN